MKATLARISILLDWLYDQLVYPIVESLASSEYHYSSNLRRCGKR